MNAAQAICILLILSMLLSVTACTSSPSLPCDGVLSAMLSFADEHPAGKTYHLSAEAGEDDYLSGTLQEMLYGELSLTPNDGVADFALYLSQTTVPFELAVFRCTTGRKATEIAKTCETRIRTLRHYFRGQEEEVILASGRVLIYENFVLMAISTDADILIAEAKRVIRGERPEKR